MFSACIMSSALARVLHCLCAPCELWYTDFPGAWPQRMDPQLRKLLECAYEAWLDSGIDHRALRGSPKVAPPPDPRLHPAIVSLHMEPFTTLYIQ